MKLQLQSAIEKIETRVDGTYKIVLGTQEINDEQAVSLIRMKKGIGWFLFKETPFEDADLVDIPETTEFKRDKTPSQRLRDRMWVFYKEKYGEDGFDDWYKKTIDKIGKAYLEKLDAKK